MRTRKLVSFILVIILSGFLAYYHPKLTGEKFDIDNYEKETCYVSRIIDGDTLVCDNETIRLLGINNKSV